jgi:TonB family protein
LAYRQEVVDTIKARWTMPVRRPGLIAAVRFHIAPTGAISHIALERSSGDGTYDETALRAVRSVERLPAPPEDYVGAFEQFVVEFHADEGGGKGG